jgi:hypothetical protein
VLILSANGQLMGARFDNSGPLTLSVQYASRSGHAAADLVIMEGVPGRHGTVQPLPQAHGADTTLTPAPGPHFYYAKVTQNDGRMLWSAPIWVAQR